MTVLDSNDAHRAIANIMNALAPLDVEQSRAVLAHAGEITEAIHGGYFLCPESEAIRALNTVDTSTASFDGSEPNTSLMTERAVTNSSSTA